MKKIKITELLPYIVGMSLAIYWIVTGDKVSSDPYLLGFFRGAIWVPIIIRTLQNLES